MNYKKIVTIALVFIICQSEQCFGQKVSVMDGYAGIDTKGMLNGSFEDRSSGFMVDNRVVRHNESDAALGGNTNRKISRKFIISPKDINSAGVYEENKGMTWAAASGFTTAANSIGVAIKAELAETGCSQYGGKDGTEKGKWRLPTQMEWMLILSFKTAILQTATITGFQAFSVLCWSATESGASYAIAVKTLSNHVSGTGKTSLFYVRCIKDL